MTEKVQCTRVELCPWCKTSSFTSSSKPHLRTLYDFSHSWLPNSFHSFPASFHRTTVVMCHSGRMHCNLTTCLTRPFIVGAVCICVPYKKKLIVWRNEISNITLYLFFLIPFLLFISSKWTKASLCNGSQSTRRWEVEKRNWAISSRVVQQSVVARC